MTKTKDFLEQLKDPENHALGKAVRAFLDEFNTVIWNVDYWERDNGIGPRVWQIEMTADRRSAVLSLVTTLEEYILEYAPNAKINRQAYQSEAPDGMNAQVYTVTF